MTPGLMLNQAIEKLKSGTTDMDDVEVFGDKSISYARLFDQLQMGHPDSAVANLLSLLLSASVMIELLMIVLLSK